MKKKDLLMTAIAIFGLATISIAQVPSYVPTNGLVGWWPFTGNANDFSGNGNNGVLVAPVLANDRFLNSNSAFTFDGIDDYIDAGTSPNLYFSSGVSISAWVNTNNVGFKIAEKQQDSPPYLIYQFFIQGTGQVGVGLRIDASNSAYTFSNELISLNQWSHVVFSWQKDINGGLCRIYINGLEATYSTQTPLTGDIAILSSLSTKFGADINPPFLEAPDGILDDIGMWNRALTECEIQDLYNAQLNSSASIQAGTDVSICEGNDIIFNASGGSNYQWNNGVQNGVAYTPTVSQDYIVIGQDVDNCFGTDTIYVEVNENTTATQTETALDSYTWPINGQTYTQSGVYTAVIPNAAGCDSTITLELSLDFTGLEDNSQGALFSVFPNPAQSIINLTVDNKLIGDVYSISDNEGRIVMTGKLTSKDTTIELNNLSGGIYMFSVGENMKQTFKVIKE
jgi:hypothetical protein